jgi:MraZ protein
VFGNIFKNSKFQIVNYFHMFIGEYKHSLDSKGRIALPVKFRQKIGSGAIITKGLDHCLFIFTSKDWEILAQKLITLPLVQANSRAFVRLMVAGAMDVELDKQGRILIPDYLREYAGLQKETVLAGVYNRIEIWNSINWQEYKTKTESSSDEIAEKLGELGI